VYFGNAKGQFRIWIKYFIEYIEHAIRETPEEELLVNTTRVEDIRV